MPRTAMLEAAHGEAVRWSPCACVCTTEGEGGCMGEAKLAGKWWPVVEEAAEGVVALEGGATRTSAFGLCSSEMEKGRG